LDFGPPAFRRRSPSWSKRRAPSSLHFPRHKRPAPLPLKPKTRAATRTPSPCVLPFLLPNLTLSETVSALSFGQKPERTKTCSLPLQSPPISSHLQVPAGPQPPSPLWPWKSRRENQGSPVAAPPPRTAVTMDGLQMNHWTAPSASSSGQSLELISPESHRRVCRRATSHQPRQLLLRSATI
jgi:hypothetical protein